MWKSHAQTPEEEWAAPGQPGPSPEVSGSPPAEPKAPLGPGPAPPHTDISFVPAPRALTAEMRSERKVTRIRGNYTAPQKVTKKKKRRRRQLTSWVSWLVCCRMWVSCSSREAFCWSSSSKASWTFWRWVWSCCNTSVSFATSSWRSCGHKVKGGREGDSITERKWATKRLWKTTFKVTDFWKDNSNNKIINFINQGNVTVTSAQQNKTREMW